MKKKLAQKIQIAELEDELKYSKDTTIIAIFLLGCVLVAAINKIKDLQDELDMRSDTGGGLKVVSAPNSSTKK